MYPGSSARDGRVLEEGRILGPNNSAANAKVPMPMLVPKP